jgi:hypothetical protein
VKEGFNESRISLSLRLMRSESQNRSMTGWRLQPRHNGQVSQQTLSPTIEGSSVVDCLVENLNMALYMWSTFFFFSSLDSSDPALLRALY